MFRFSGALCQPVQDYPGPGDASMLGSWRQYRRKSQDSAEAWNFVIKNRTHATCLLTASAGVGAPTRRVFCIPGMNKVGLG